MLKKTQLASCVQTLQANGSFILPHGLVLGVAAEADGAAISNDIITGE